MKKTLGRPRTNDEKRVSFTCMVKPSTRATIDSMSESRGKVIDKLIEEYLTKLNFDSRG